MQLLKLTASFGTLDNRTLTLSPGLNVIEAPNESGKSTWCAFIRAMLYGVDSAERARAGYLPDKTRYAPWSGAPMQGSMDILWRGREITVTRRTRTASAPMREAAAVYTGTDEPVPALRGEGLGERLTGVPASVFDRSAYIRQSAIGVTGSPELEKRIASIVSTGDEEDSYTEADERLRAWLRKRRHNKYGALPELENELLAAEASLKTLRSAASDAERLSESLTRAEARRDALLTELEQSRADTRKRALESVAEGKRETKRLEAGLEVEEQLLEKRRAELSSHAFGELAPSELRAQTEADASRAAACETASHTKRKNLAVWSAVCAFIFAAGLCLALALDGAVSAVMFAAAGLGIVAAALLLLSYMKRGRAIDAARAELTAILEKYGVTVPGDIPAVAVEHAELYAAAREAEQGVERARRELAEHRERREEKNTELLQALNFGAAPDDSGVSGELAAAESRLRALRDERAMAEGRLRTLGDPLVMESAIDELKSRREELSAQYDALSLAIATLSDANAEIQTRFSPLLARRATELLSRMTEGRYGEIALDRRFSAAARREGDALPHESGYLSSGAADQLWLALRLAICELALPDEDTCPLILDDVLVNFDPARRDAALSLLREIAETRQVILFCCK